MGIVREMRYNSVCLGEQNTRALCLSEAAPLSQLHIVGKAPSINGHRSVLAVRLDTGSAIRGGLFAVSNKGKLIDETGNRYGRLTVIKYVKNPKRGAYWLCKCDCGNETVVGAYHLRAGTTRSCGCIVQENGRKYIRDIAGANALPPEEAAFRRLLNNYKQSARRRGLKFAISKEMFRALTKQRCHYCGQEPSRIYAGSEGRGEYFYNGIDRKDNERGYEEDNCVPCCATCNSNKGTKTYSEFVEYLDRIAAFRGSGKCT